MNPASTVLARPTRSLPAGGALPGGCRYEPKFDGFRAVTRVATGQATIWSRHGTDMTAAFPELADAATAQLPDGVTLDGEVVAWADGRLDFDILLRRLNAGKARQAAFAERSPASLVLFDVMEVAGRDIRHHPFDVRRALLEELALDWRPPLSLSPVTRDRDEAVSWMEDMAAAGIEGIVTKGGAQAYRPGERDWVKTKRWETVDVTVGAVTGSLSRPRELIIGQVVDGKLRIVGRTTPLTPAQARTVAGLIRPPRRAHPWPEVVSSSVVSRFRKTREPVVLTLIEPVPAEVSADAARTGYSFRHPVRFVKLRTDLPQSSSSSVSSS